LKTNINPQLIIRGDYESLPDNIIGVAVTLNLDEVQNPINHSGIFIRYNNSNYLLHFNREAIELVEIPEDSLVFFKQISVPTGFILSTYHFFTQIIKRKVPEYGYFYSGSFYDETTLDFIDGHGMPEIMSCVGFCLNVMKTVLRGKDFIKYTDWNYHDGLTEDKVLRYFMKAKKSYPDLDMDEYIKYVRRILPIEYFTAGFEVEAKIPVRKTFTDANIRIVDKMIMDRVASA